MHHYIRSILLLGLVFALTACGSSRSNDETGETDFRSFGSDSNGIAFLGADRCIECHEGPAFAGDLVDDYLGSAHVVHSTAINAASPQVCLDCHDPIGDGITLEGYVAPGNVPSSGLAAVGCEACHGAGGQHFGANAMPNSTPDFNTCGSCHTALPAGPGGHAGSTGAGILEEYLAGPHAATLQGTSFALCSRCHSDEGFRAFAEETAGMSAPQLQFTLSGAEAPVNPSTVQCRTCHDSHSAELRAAVTASVQGGSTVTQFSQEFNLCTTCHQVFLEATFDPITQAFSYELDRTLQPFHGTAGNPLADADMGIWDTHFPSPADGIAGYGIDAAAVNACTNCHNPHSTE